MNATNIQDIPAEQIIEIFCKLLQFYCMILDLSREYLFSKSVTEKYEKPKEDPGIFLV